MSTGPFAASRRFLHRSEESVIVETPPTPQIETVELTTGGTRLVLPRRDLGRLRLLAIAAAWILAGVACWFLWKPLSAFCAEPANFATIFQLAIRLLFAAFLFCLPARWLLHLLYGHVDIEVASGQLLVVKKLWWWSRTKVHDSKNISSLQIVVLGPELDGTPAADNRPGALGTLTAIRPDGKRFVIAMAYPRQLLDVLSTEISSRLPWPVADGQQSEPASPPPLVSKPVGIGSVVAELASRVTTPPKPEELLTQPKESRIRLQIHDDGLEMVIPARGVWGDSFGLFQIGLILLAVTFGFTVLFAFATPQGGIPKAIIGMSPFWLGAGAMLLFSWNNGRRQTAIAIVAEELRLLQISPLRTRELSWTRAEIAGIDIGNSGMEINDVPVRELQILGPKGRLFGMLAGHSHAEIIWAATMLRYALDGRPFPPEVETSQLAGSADHPSKYSGTAEAAIPPLLLEPEPEQERAFDPKKIAAFYADSLGGFGTVLGKMMFFFCWVPILGLMMIVPLGAFGLLVAGIVYVTGIVRGPELRWQALKAAGVCLLALGISAATTLIPLYILWRMAHPG
jgi:hypothetical protein